MGTPTTITLTVLGAADLPTDNPDDTAISVRISEISSDLSDFITNGTDALSEGQIKALIGEAVNKALSTGEPQLVYADGGVTW